MSTATIDHSSITLPGHPFAPRAGQRRRLRLVGEGERAARPAARRAQALRITRRGRLAVTTTVALVIALAAGSFLLTLGPAGATTSVVVEPGMTLTQIAAEQLPDVPLSQAVTDIQRANKLSTASIAVGQELVVPGR